MFKKVLLTLEYPTYEQTMVTLDRRRLIGRLIRVFSTLLSIQLVLREVQPDHYPCLVPEFHAVVLPSGLELTGQFLKQICLRKFLNRRNSTEEFGCRVTRKDT